MMLYYNLRYLLALCCLKLERLEEAEQALLGTPPGLPTYYHYYY